MKIVFTTLFALCLILTSCSPSPENALEKTREKYANTQYISYRSTSLWPDMIGVVDTIESRVEILNDDSPLTGYSFSESKNKYDVLYSDGLLQVFLHEEKKVRSEKPDDLSNKMSVAYNPITYVSESGWVFNNDTIIDGTSLLYFSMVEKDTVYNGAKLLVSKNLYINPKDYSVSRQERLAFRDDSLTQKIINIFEAYEFDNLKNELSFTLPEGYITRASNEASLKMPEIGEVAPNFSAITIDGDSISLSDYRGQKVLIDISVINCGYCKIALSHINTAPNLFNENIKALYINPTDSKERMTKYLDQVAIPFPVITNRKDIGDAYGVNGYPTFFLINEDGIVEDVHQGYSKEFIDSFL